VGTIQQLASLDAELGDALVLEVDLGDALSLDAQLTD
jgi:predicted nucleotidyltransferase